MNTTANPDLDHYIHLRKEEAKNIIKTAIKLYLEDRVNDDYFKGVITGICIVCNMRLERCEALEHLQERVKKSRKGGEKDGNIKKSRYFRDSL